MSLQTVNSVVFDSGSNICDEENHFRCVTTLNCVLPSWLNDGVDDCGDNSDEDPCVNGMIVCNESNKTVAVEHPYAFTTTHDYQKHEGKCMHGEFQCRRGDECIPVYMVLDGTPQCSDESDENYCQLQDVLKCENPKQPCSFNPSIAAFTCGCPIGCHRTKEGVCRPMTIPQYASDCADLQLQYPKLTSGEYTVYNTNCVDPKLCGFLVFCDMETFGGGWTVFMQRLNTSVSFAKLKTEYEEGFRIDRNNFWLGLAQIKSVTDRCANELMLRMRTSTSNRIIIVRYSHVSLCGKEMGYRLNLGPQIYDSQLGIHDELASSRMAPFVTGDELNCTTKSWGWWSSSCNLKGILTAPNFAHDNYNGITWQGQRIIALQMLIRNKVFIPPIKLTGKN